MNKPISQACLRNQAAIADALAVLLPRTASILEVGSGTGQHAVFCAQQLSYLTWQPSDLIQHHEGMKQWLAEANLKNVLPPLVLDVDNPWPALVIDHVFTANTVHYISEQSVDNMFANVSALLPDQGMFIIYGPVNENGTFTSEGNARLDEWLKECVNPMAGIKEFNTIKQQAEYQGLVFVNNIEMPANNRLLVFKKIKQ